MELFSNNLEKQQRLAFLKKEHRPILNRGPAQERGRPVVGAACGADDHPEPHRGLCGAALLHIALVGQPIENKT